MEEQRQSEEEPRMTSPSAAPEKRETSTIDMAYSSSVARYFNRRKSECIAGRENPTDEDLQYEQFLSEQQSMLAKVANSRLLEKLQPKDISFALSELAGMMANNNPDYYGGQDPNSNVDQEKEYLEAKKIFMATCKKMFPEIEPEMSRSVTYTEVEKLSRLDIPVVSVPMSEGGELLQKNPKELARRMDGILHSSGDVMKSYAFDGFCADDIKETEAIEKKLGTAVMSVYKLQLMRDRLTEKIYGRADMTPSETKQIDEAREKAN